MTQCEQIDKAVNSAMVSVGRYDGYSKRDDGHDACVTTCT